ncbi:hypothetical protein BCR36DRAFT_163333 [Piromyces finnis]|uniref:RING-CH-type domain-containing protein n=1 Tax=Piromyces finnis TaxID=1754191 RepID=A0A1Y1VIT3_9FUNG|nr:hypothetical protein BCR36DRAFT_163333 [Piromyces finnis]|eukprot:ORX56557.1 hypothetical protein BCR36DRAFT_163333 [Piromyces finnis]
MALDANENKSYYRCFICWDDIEFEDSSTKIVSACNCISTDFKYTHKECLNLWINQNKRSELKCQVCNSCYHVKKVLKPFKKIYMENWKKISCFFISLILINSIVLTIYIRWSKKLESINYANYFYSSDIEDSETINSFNEWFNSIDERENFIEDYFSEISFGRIFQNIYCNFSFIIVFINTVILVFAFYHEIENFVEYSIDEKYEYKKHFKLSNHHSIENKEDTFSNYEYQKIRVI